VENSQTNSMGLASWPTDTT